MHRGRRTRYLLITGFALLLMITAGSGGFIADAMAQQSGLPVVGWIEKARLVMHGLNMHVRHDSGAPATSINAIAFTAVPYTRHSSEGGNPFGLGICQLIS